MTKVLHLRSSGSFLGAEKVLIELGRHLPRYGIESIIGIPVDRHEVPELAERAADLNIRCELFHFNHILSARGIRQIRDFVRREKIDVIHCHGYREDIYAFAVLDTKRVVATNHLWKRTTTKLKIYAALDAWVMKYFHTLVAVSQPILDEMLQKGLSARQLRLIENGISLDDYSVDCLQRNAMRLQFGLAETDFVFGMVSSLSEEKGHTYAFKAFAEIIRQGFVAKLLVVGDGPEAAQLKQLAKRLGVGDNVVFTGRRSDVPKVLQSFTVFLMPSLIEGLPMALLEAMATAIPVIAASVGDIPKVVSPEVGLLVPPMSVEALVCGMKYMLENTDELSAMGGRARDLINEKFSAENMARRYAEIYGEVIESQTKGRT